MAAPVPCIEPTSFAAGETIAWTKVVGDYPNTEGWSLVYLIRGPSVFADVTATNLTDGSYSILVPTTVTGPLLPGTYKWASYAYQAGPPILRYAISTGVMRVTVNMSLEGAVTSHAVRTLAVIEAALEGRTTADVQQYMIAGRQIQKIPISELYGLRSKYRVEVWRERNPNRNAPTRGIAFTRPAGSSNGDSSW